MEFPLPDDNEVYILRNKHYKDYKNRKQYGRRLQILKDRDFRIISRYIEKKLYEKKYRPDKRFYGESYEEEI